MSLVVTGATGQLGRLAVTALLAKGVPADQILALGRDEERLAGLAALGVRTQRVDYGDRASLDAAFTGAERVLFVSGSEVGSRLPQHRNVIDAAKDAGVQLLAYTSISNAGTANLGLAAEHKATEEAIVASGVPHTFLRNSWYLENYTDHLATYLQHGAVLGSAGDGQVSAATRADYAEAAASALLAEHPAAVYELGGRAFGLAELAATVTEVTGQQVAYADVPATELVAALTGAGVPQPFAEVLADADLGLGRGELYVDPADLETLLGRPATTLAEAVRAAA